MGSRPAIGIDIGMYVAVWKNGRIEYIPKNDQGNSTTPAFTRADRVNGDTAKNQQAVNSTNTIF
nr:heat shock cognate 70 kDa protein-like [Tanacetum cinerariifolium]